MPSRSKQRLAIVAQMRDRLQVCSRESREQVKAIRLAGSLARGDDGLFSAIKLLCMPICQPKRSVYEWWSGPWKAEVDFATVEVIQEKARAAKSSWALAQGVSLQRQPLSDPEAFLSTLQPPVFSESPQSACRGG